MPDSTITEKTRGFITIATGEEKYYRFAVNLLMSYRLYCPNPMPFAIMCDQENTYTAEFDQAVLFRKSEHPYFDKFELLKLAPYDETIFISLNQIPINVEFMIVGITSYENMPMNKVKGGFLRVIDRASKKEIMFLPLSNQEKKTGLLFAIFKRVNDDSWDLYPVIQYFQDGKNPNGANGYFLSMLNDPCSLETLLNYG